MSHYHQKKRDYDDSTDQSDSSSRTPCSQTSACILCPPCDNRERYDSESSDQSCPDFSDLCEDKPRQCEENAEAKKERKEKKSACKKGGCKKSGCKKSGCKQDSDSSSDEESDAQSSSGRTCFQGCPDGECRCGGQPCRDYSKSSVLDSLGPSDGSHCPDLDDLINDKKRICDQPTGQQPTCKQGNCQQKKHVSKNVKPVKDQDAEKISSTSGRGKKFIVSFGLKKSHPWEEYNSTNTSIHINGKNGPVLHLYRDSTYFFCLQQETAGDSHSFILTNSPAGGANARIVPGSFESLTKGVVAFKVDKLTPRYFYYQDAKNQFVGGLVIVHDKDQ